MTENNSKIYMGGKRNHTSYLSKESQGNQAWLRTTLIDEPNEVRKIVSGNNINCLVWKGINKLDFYQQNIKSKKSYTVENEEIKDIHSGYATYLILTKSGKVYSLADSKKSNYCEIPLTDPNKSNYNEIRSVPFFNDEKNNRKVKQIAMVGWSNYYLCEDNKLYGNGYNQGRLGDGTTNAHRNIPVLIKENVERVFGGNQSWYFFLTTQDNELFSCGENGNGQLAQGNTSKAGAPIKVQNWKAEDILDIYCLGNFSILVTKEGKVYTCGSSSHNGFGTVNKTFKQITELINEKIVKIFGGYAIVLLQTSENELYGWNFESNFYLKSNNKTITNFQKPTKIDLPEIYQNNKLPYDFTCGTQAFFIYPKYNTVLKQDFKNLYKSKKYSDSKIGSNEREIPVHKGFVESRIGEKMEEIKKKLINFSNEEINTFLKWVYYGNRENLKSVKPIFDLFHLKFPPHIKDFENDLLKLYKDEDSKDFSILVDMNNEDNDEDEDEDEENEDEDFEEIPVHRIVLIARSGLFREMFDNIQENSNKVKDFSGKTIESLEILIHYLYTDKIELTADDDPQLVVEELEDAIEYYQLNKNCSLKDELQKIKRQFDLK
ncbi:btk-binding protein-related [Anaeramoeba flamelloides]|uniref:Btk-binding protein-related n=1 Tax=Anaeramoeba flamelloides TaxID=1746091 RepID=A0AAV8A5J2_9EUKA|nr:btk-binding protein-related [Anaeramoeba flamelloides]